MGGAQPLAVKLAGGVSICVEVDPTRMERRLKTRYLDRATASLDEAISMAQQAKRSKTALSIGLLGQCRGGAAGDGARPDLHLSS